MAALATGALLLIAMAASPAADAPLALSPSDRAALTRIRNAQDKAELTLLVAGAGASDWRLRRTGERSRDGGPEWPSLVRSAGERVRCTSRSGPSTAWWA